MKPEIDNLRARADAAGVRLIADPARGPMMTIPVGWPTPPNQQAEARALAAAIEALPVDHQRALWNVAAIRDRKAPSFLDWDAD
jgi:hypothetical protein